MGALLGIPLCWACCSMTADRRQQKKIKPSTGIPKSWLRVVPKENVPNIDSEIYVMSDGTFSVLKDPEALSSDAFFARSIEQRIIAHLGPRGYRAGAGRPLYCGMCSQLFKQPVIMPCCGETYCFQCVSHENATRGSRKRLRSAPLSSNTRLKIDSECNSKTEPNGCISTDDIKREEEDGNGEILRDRTETNPPPPKEEIKSPPPPPRPPVIPEALLNHLQGTAAVLMSSQCPGCGTPITDPPLPNRSVSTAVDAVLSVKCVT
eukprot:GHVO01034014.1.p1 GENE.GHVO01034014.1~~GHVO01034014.1.p1  ORF type:complete len:263 (+),score=43.99 GHVO01034014.1:140-928(+)